MDASSPTLTIDGIEFDHEAWYETLRKSFTREPFDHYVNGICGLFICLLGTISNALSFSVLVRRTMRLSTYVYLAGLCLSDFTTCLFLIPGYILDAYPIEVPDFELPRTYAYTKILIISGAISTTGRVLSVWLCVAFTIDRWIMICRPFAGPIYCTIENARRVTTIIYILGVFYAVPLMFEYEPHADRSLSEILLFNNNKKIYRHKLTELGSSTIFRWTYVLINALGVYIIPLITIIILNRKLLTSIRSIQRRSIEYNAPLPTKQGVTVMLLATTVLLLVFRSPSAIISVMWLISAKMFVNEKPPFRLRKFHSIANLCATLNAATTFIMFIIYGAKFRTEFTRIYCFLINMKNMDRTTTRRLDEQHQQMNELIRHHNENEHKLRTNSLTNRNSVPITIEPNGNIYKELSRYNSSSTTSTSVGPFSLMQHFKKHKRKQQFSFDQESDIMMNNKDGTDINRNPHESTHQGDDCNDEHNNTKSILLTDSYSGWFKNFFRCH